jgi:hypothetical protein
MILPAEKNVIVLWGLLGPHRTCGYRSVWLQSRIMAALIA